MDNLFHHNTYMQAALQEAKEAALADEVPIGAVIVYKGDIIARAGNRVERDKNPTAHAEMIVIQMAAKILGDKRIPDCDLYVSLEPCTMCAGAIAQARIKTIVFAAQDPKGGGVFHGARFFEQPTCHHRPEIIHLSDFDVQAGDMLRDFFKRKREAKKL